MAEIYNAEVALQQFMYDNMNVSYNGETLPRVVENAGGDDTLASSTKPYISFSFDPGTPTPKTIGTMLLEYEGILTIYVHAPINVNPMVTKKLVSEVATVVSYKRKVFDGTELRFRGVRTYPGKTIGTHYIVELSVETKFLSSI